MQFLASRIKLIILLTGCAFITIGLALFHLQVYHMNLFMRRAQNNFTRQENVSSPRGNITDCHGTLLATNRPVYILYWQGTGQKILTSHQKEMLSVLNSLFSLPDEFTKRLQSIERRCDRALIATDISLDQLTCILEQYPHEKNIHLEKSYKRCYPYKDLACHLVGYLGFDAEMSGKMGIEQSCNKALKGHSGKILKIINSIGRHVNAHYISAAVAGKTLQTTLDLRLQKIAEEVFPEDERGCCICMDEAGAIEVMLSRPTFDPSIFLKPLSTAQWKELQEKNGFMNRALSGCYPPASLFKMATLAAALETGLISPAMKWHCVGHTDFKGRAYHCNNKKGHGVLSTEQALAHSCNIPFFEIGKKIKIDTLANYAQKLGLGIKTGILLPEKAGLIPTRNWKLRVKKEPWWPGETLSAAIGQGPMFITPLQVTGMIHALTTGFHVTPRILIDEPIIKTPLELQPTTRSFLQQCLRSVIKQGTAAYLRQLTQFKISGKTGTAQVCCLEKATLSKKHLCHGYFVAHFQYKNEKPRTLMIFVENAGSSSVAIRIAMQFYKKYASLCNQTATI